MAARRRVLAVVQLRATRDVGRNVSRARELVRRARTELDAAFVCLPEAADYVGEGTPGTLDGDAVRGFGEIARDEGVWLSVGGVHEVAAEPNNTSPKKKQFNTHVVFDAAGRIRATYRKVHLFDAAYDGGWRESDSTLAGDKLVVVRNTPVGNVALATCYDMRFPAMFQAYAQAGADVVLLPSAFMVTTGKAHWEVLLRARAIECQVYVAAAAQCGAHNERRTSYGHSLIVDPFGTVLVDLKQGDPETNEAVGGALVDVARLAEVRRAMPMVMHQERARAVVGVAVAGGAFVSVDGGEPDSDAGAAANHTDHADDAERQAKTRKVA